MSETDTPRADVLTSHSLVGIAASADLTTAALLMVKKNIGALGVYSTDGSELLGIVSERDITRAVAAGRDPARTSVKETMTSPPLIKTAPMTARKAKRLMAKFHVRHLVVKDGGDHIVSLRDV